MTTPDEPIENYEPIEKYLDELLTHSRGNPRRVRWLLAETEAHLRDATAAAVAAGSTPEEAAREAVARFGPASAVTAREPAGNGPVAIRSLAREVGLAGSFLVGVGLVAVGVSGALNALLAATVGNRFVAGDPPGITYTTQRCAEYLSSSPGANDCTQAALLDHVSEMIVYRLAAGLLGVLVLLGWAFARRRLGGLRGVTVLPAAAVPVAAATVFGIAAAVLCGQAVDYGLIANWSGSGSYLTGGVVALAVCAWHLRDCWRQIGNFAAQPAPPRAA